MTPSTGLTRDCVNQILCGLAVVISVLACLPFVEAGFNDDWTYAHMALSLARTGHFAYESATNATILFQTYLGGFLIRQFGFSFELLRFATLPFGVGCGILCYRVARATGLSPSLSLFASLGFVTSPLFLPLAASFMSDVYACFFMLLSLYLGACARGKSLSNRRRVLWLLASVLVGYAGGLERQTVYFAPCSVLIWAICRWRRDRPMLTASVCMLCALVTASYLTVRWQIYLPLPADDIRVFSFSWRLVATYPARLILTLTLLILPAVVRFGKGGFRIQARIYALSAFCVLGGFTLYWRVSHHLLFPWEANMLTPFGILSSGEEMRGQRPMVMSHWVRETITLAVLFVLIRVGAVLLGRPRESRLWKVLSESPAMTQMLAIFGVFQAAFLWVRSGSFTFDRYLLPLVPVAMIMALLSIQRRAGSSLTVANWSLLGIFALYGIGITHDYFAALQARVAAQQKVEASGVPPRNITGGLELDGWTQSEITSHVQSAPARRAKLDPIYTRYWSAVFMPDIDPHYYLSWSDEPGLRRAATAGVVFRAWLPPFRREIKILVPEK